jgi:hypothetical protein
MRTLEFLTAERDHAERHLARVRRIQATLQQNLESAGLDEVTVYERLIASKAYRQLQRDEAFYQQMWLRISRQLDKHPIAKIDEEIASIERDQQARAQHAQSFKPQTVRYTTPPPGRNQVCPCGSNLKYKRCCGNPLKQAA